MQPTNDILAIALVPAIALAASLLSGCADPVPPPVPATPAPVPAADAGAAESVAGSWQEYRCADGSTAGVRYSANSVELLIGGAQVQLPKAQSASKGPGDAYVGQSRSLYRKGDTIQLHGAGADAPLTCTRR